MNYSDFIERKQHVSGDSGFAPLFMSDFLFDFQSSLTEWSLLKGRAEIAADCGLGKSPMQLVWAENVHRKTNKPVLIVTPLAVSYQTERESEKFQIESKVSREGKVHNGIVITNYERLHYFDWKDFSGMVCDESSILKNFEGSTKAAITDFMRKLEYRLLCTATPAPNDFVELGTSSEALGGLGYMDMLGMFFKNDSNSLHMNNARVKGQESWFSGKWRFKRHAEKSFWRWVCSWMRACRKPSDLGFDDGKFTLPELEERCSIVQASRPMNGMLFSMPAHGLSEQRSERKHTINERCEKVAELLDHDDYGVAWCNLNPEGDLLEKLLKDCVQISGKDSDESKEEKFLAFVTGQVKKLVTKPEIAGFGLNFQHCNHCTVFPSHSFEQYYQLIRRFYRFGQTRKVIVDNVTTEGESEVLDNRKRKALAADEMFSSLIRHMNESLSINKSSYGTNNQEIPNWLSSTKTCTNDTPYTTAIV